MADINKLIPHILRWEGGYNDIKEDAGGATNKGITIKTWIANGRDKDFDGDIDKEDLKLITVEDFKDIFKKFYWDKCKADKIDSQSVANILVDWCYNSGGISIEKVQGILGLDDDGIVGPNTLKMINSTDSKVLFDKIWAARYKFYQNIVARKPSQIKFLKGWMNRLNSFTFEA